MNSSNDWSLVPLSKIAADEKGAIRRGPFGGSIKKEYFVPSGYKVYEQKNAIASDFDIGNYFINEDKYRELEGFSIKSQDLIISCAGTIGKIAIIPDDAKPGVINQALMRIRPNQEIILPQYLKYYLESPVAIREIFGKVAGTALKNLAAISEIKKSKIPLPPLEEQKRIVTILDKADAIRRKRKESIALTKELLRSTFLDMFGDPVTNPKGWEVVKLEKILGEPFQNGAYYPKDKYSDSNDSIEMVHMSDAFYGVAQPGNLKRVLASKKEIEQYGLNEGDVLINRRSLNYEGSAKPCLIPDLKEPLIFESSLIRVRVHQDIIDPIFFYSYMLQPRARAAYVFPYVTKSTISGINQTGLKQVKILVPPVKLQLEYKEFYKQVTCTIKSHEKSLNNKNNLFNSLLQTAFRGEL